MRNFPPEVREALADRTTMIAMCWSITRRDGYVLRLTDFDEDVVHAGATYRAAGGGERSAVQLSDAMSADSVKLRGLFRPGLITEADIHFGLYDFAYCEVKLVFANGATEGEIALTAGNYGNVEIEEGGYSIELRGLTHQLQANIGEMTSPGCRATFADLRCKAPKLTWQRTYTIESVASSRTIVLAGAISLPPGVTYNQGLLEVLDGPAENFQSEIRQHVGQAVEAYNAMTILPVAGNTVRLTAGCDKNFSSCVNLFNNAINFQGEPHLPGVDELFAPKVTNAN